MIPKQILAILMVGILLAVLVFFFYPLEIVTVNEGPGVLGTTEFFHLVGPSSTEQTVLNSGKRCAQSFTMPIGYNRLVNYVIWVKQTISPFGGEKIKIGIATSLTWTESNWIKTVTVATTGSGRILTLIDEDETTVYTPNTEYFVMFQLASDQGTKFVDIGRFSTNVYARGEFYDSYDSQFNNKDLGFTAMVGYLGSDNEAPVVTGIDGPSSGLEDQTMIFSCMASDPEGSPITYRFNWGDNQYSGWQTSSQASHDWVLRGTYDISCMVSDGLKYTDWCCKTIVIGELGTLTVSTSDATDVTMDSVELNGNLVDTGGDVCGVNFQWGTSPTYGYSTLIQTKDSTGSYNFFLGDLIPDTQYYFRARAQSSSSGVVYGSQKSFTTLPVGSQTYTVTFIVVDSEDNEKISGVSIEFNSETKNTNSEGSAIFTSVSEGSKTVSATKTGFKPLEEEIEVTEDTTKYITLAPVDSDDDSGIDDDIIPGGTLTITIIAIIVGSILTIISIAVAPGVVKIIIPIAVWVIIAIIYLLL